MEKYSVLMSLYYKEKPEYLRQSLDSMINQTAKPDEIVMVYDGLLTNDLYKVMNEYIEQYPQLFTIVKNESNLGLGLSLNKGLLVCKNELVARMDTDDISKPNRCEKQLYRFKEKPYLTIVGSHIDEFVDVKENIISSRKVPVNFEDIYEFAKRRSAFNHPAVMYKKEDILKENGYSDLKRNQDVELFGRMLFSGYQAENIDESLLWYRVNDDLAKRRKTWGNTLSYIKTIKKFWKMGYSNFFDFLIVMYSQLILYIMPVKVQHIVYKVFLRSGGGK